ncbi:MAG: tetratricopeptide repeat protein [Bacteroidales bacterium]
MYNKVNRYTIVFFITFLILLLPFKALGQEREKWDNANSLYAQGSYSEALEEYLLLEEEGYISWPLYYNIANSYFKNKNYGRSILYYERALKLNPSGKDIKVNLSYAKQFAVDKIDEIPEFILSTWIRELNYMLASDYWAIISIALFILVALLLLNFRYGANAHIRKASFFISMVSLLFALFFTLFAWNQRNTFHRKDTAIVMSAVSTVRNSPDNSGSTLFILHEGAKLQIIEQLGDWKRIELADGRQGWITVADIEII